MHDALRADSVRAPGLHEDRRWLLYQSPSLDMSDGQITCFLCRKCCTALASSNSAGRPYPRLPAEARTNGLWRGPDPPELSSLSYTEAKVMNLARMYVIVKRVFLNSASIARTSGSEAPLYHHRNVVGFPTERRQDSDVAWHLPWCAGRPRLGAVPGGRSGGFAAAPRSERVDA